MGHSLLRLVRCGINWWHGAALGIRFRGWVKGKAVGLCGGHLKRHEAKHSVTSGDRPQITEQYGARQIRCMPADMPSQQQLGTETHVQPQHLKLRQVTQVGYEAA